MLLPAKPGQLQEWINMLRSGGGYQQPPGEPIPCILDIVAHEAEMTGQGLTPEQKIIERAAWLERIKGKGIIYDTW